MNQGNIDLLSASINSLITAQATLRATHIANAITGGAASSQIQGLEDLVTKAREHLANTIKFVFKDIP